MGTWTRIGSKPRSVQAVQDLTEADPTLPPTALGGGVFLEGVECIVPVLHAPGGQTFTGVGRLRGFIWTGTMWVPAPRSDIDLFDASGTPDWTAPALLVDSPQGFFQLVPTGVTLSGAGTQITTEYLCTLTAGGGAMPG